MKLLLPLLFSLMLTACASVPKDFVFDGSTPESTQQDIQHVLNKLGKQKRLEFSIALMAIQFSDVRSVNDFIGDPAMEGFNYHLIGKKIDGMTYQEVLALADKSPTKISVQPL